MKKSELAVKSFVEGNSCAQAILTTYCSDVGLSQSQAYRIGVAFGGGMGRKQNTCGAITGGVVLLGMKYGNSEAGEPELKEQTSQIVFEFISECEAALGCSSCKDLLKIDLKNPNERNMATQSGLFDRVCNNAVEKTAVILEKYLNK